MANILKISTAKTADMYVVHNQL